MNLGYTELLDNKEETEILDEKEGKLEACQNDTVKVEVDSQDGEYDVDNDVDPAVTEDDQVYEEQEGLAGGEQEDNDDVHMTDVDTTVPDISEDTIEQV